MKCLDVNPSDGASSLTSPELLRAAQHNDREAWRHLVGTYSRRMYRWCRLAGLQPADSANVVQESFAAVARKLGDFRHDRPGATFRGWLRRIVDNKVTDHFRLQCRRVDLPVGGTDAHQRMTRMATPENDAHQQDVEEFPIGRSGAAQAAMNRAIAEVRHSVGERDWTFFWRVVVDGQPAADVAREFGVTANAVRLVKMRVLRRMRGSIGDRVQEPAERS
jgi:RNA polymerase sigma-70 factor (ECF subfamily)